jgi:hypothetical protein
MLLKREGPSDRPRPSPSSVKPASCTSAWCAQARGHDRRHRLICLLSMVLLRHNESRATSSGSTGPTAAFGRNRTPHCLRLLMVRSFSGRAAPVTPRSTLRSRPDRTGGDGPTCGMQSAAQSPAGGPTASLRATASMSMSGGRARSPVPPSLFPVVMTAILSPSCDSVLWSTYARRAP